MKHNKVKIEQGQLRAAFSPSTFNKEKRTIDVVFTTGSKVRRYDWWEGRFYYEELDVSEKSMRLERLRAGASVLNNHDANTLSDVLGVVEDARVEAGKGIATVRFSDREDIQGIVRDIENGIIRNISVGYVVHKYVERKEEKDEFPTYRATDWEPMEISFVAIPADAKSQVRNAEKNNFFEVTIENRGDDMPKTDENPEQKPVETPVETPVEASKTDENPAVEPEKTVENERKTVENSTNDAIEAAKQAELDRQKTIREAVREAKLDESIADKLCHDLKMSVDEARKEIFKTLERKTQDETKNLNVEVKDMDKKIEMRNEAVQALLNRAEPTKFKYEGREFRQESLTMIARHFLAQEGVADAYRMPKAELVRRALHTSSDFGSVLEDLVNKSLRAAYMGAPNTYAPFVDMKQVDDFKEISSVQLGNGGKLEKVNEHGEYKRTTLKDSAQKYKVEKYGLVLGRTYELMMNDDLDAFARIPMKLGQRAMEKENEIFWALIIANQVMAETGNGLFHASHNNLGTAGVIGLTTLSEGRKKMRLQKDLDGELISIAPSWLVVPAAQETLAEQFISQSILAETPSNTNPFYNKLKPIVEPRLDAASATAWYLMADKSQIAIGSMATLSGKSGPEMFVREGFDVDGMELKIRHEFGMAIVDYRGAFKNAGA